MRRRRPIADRFWPKVDIGHKDECWNWTGTKMPRGYGHIGAGGHDGPMLYAHRVAMELATGNPIPPGKEVCHHCDNPSCVNPAHLFIGTHAENFADMTRKGRSTRGERNPRAKLTAKKVAEIRTLLAAGQARRAVADQFGVGVGAVGKIARRERWAAA